MLIGLLSDIHEDIVQLSAALKLLERENVDEVVCLGDMIGFSVPFYGHLRSRDANGVIALIKDQCSVVVAGNHDLYAARKLPQHRAFFDYPADWYTRDFHERKRLADGKIFLYEDNELSPLLSRANLDYLRELPEYVIKDVGGHRIMFSHYPFPDFTGSSTASIAEYGALRGHFAFMESVGCLYSFSGNDHVEGARVFTPRDKQSCRFGTFQLTAELSVINGPATCAGTTDNGLLIYDSKRRSVGAHRLDAPKHIPPDVL